MFISRREFATGSLGTLGSALIAGPGGAQQAYPNKPVRITIGFAAGSGADILTRYYAKKMEELTRQSFLIENKPGASGNLATRQVTSAPADGYNLLFSANSGIVGSRFLFKELAFDTIRDLRPAATFAAITFVVVVGPKSDVNSIPELVAKLKAKKDNLFAYTNPTGLLSAESIKMITGAPAKSVAYRTTADVMRDLQDGTIDFMVMDGTFATQQILQGQLKPLAVTTNVRAAALPNVPPLAEAGVPGFNFSPWWSVWAPAGTPQAVLDKLESLVKQINDMPETKPFLESVGSVPLFQTGKVAYERTIDEDKNVWPPLIKAAGIEPQ
jgi:tripartite-type tricarboxylate transporter receptor subunit TctC